MNLGQSNHIAQALLEVKPQIGEQPQWRIWQEVVMRTAWDIKEVDAEFEVKRFYAKCGYIK